MGLVVSLEQEDPVRCGRREGKEVKRGGDRPGAAIRGRPVDVVSEPDQQPAEAPRGEALPYFLDRMPIPVRVAEYDRLAQGRRRDPGERRVDRDGALQV